VFNLFSPLLLLLRCAHSSQCNSLFSFTTNPERRSQGRKEPCGKLNFGLVADLCQDTQCVDDDVCNPTNTDDACFRYMDIVWSHGNNFFFLSISRSLIGHVTPESSLSPPFSFSYLKCFSMALDFSLPPPKTLNINVMSMYRLTTLKNNLSVSYFIYFRR
jgi:hypothetical protein